MAQARARAGHSCCCGTAPSGHIRVYPCLSLTSLGLPCAPGSVASSAVPSALNSTPHTRRSSRVMAPACVQRVVCARGRVRARGVCVGTCVGTCACAFVCLTGQRERASALHGTSTCQTGHADTTRTHTHAPALLHAPVLISLTTQHACGSLPAGSACCSAARGSVSATNRWHRDSLTSRTAASARARVRMRTCALGASSCSTARARAAQHSTPSASAPAPTHADASRTRGVLLCAAQHTAIHHHLHFLFIPCSPCTPPPPLDAAAAAVCCVGQAMRRPAHQRAPVLARVRVQPGADALWGGVEAVAQWLCLGAARAWVAARMWRRLRQCWPCWRSGCAAGGVRASGARPTHA